MSKPVFYDPPVSWVPIIALLVIYAIPLGLGIGWIATVVASLLP